MATEMSIMDCLPYSSPCLGLQLVGSKDRVHFIDRLGTFPDVTLVAYRGDLDTPRPLLPFRFRLNKLVLSAASMMLKNLLRDYIFNENQDDSVVIMTEVNQEHLELFREFLLTGCLRRDNLDDSLKESFLNLGVNLDGLTFELADFPNNVKFEVECESLEVPMFEVPGPEVEPESEPAMPPRRKRATKKCKVPEDIWDEGDDNFESLEQCKEEPVDDDYYNENQLYDAQMDEGEFLAVEEEEEEETTPRKRRKRSARLDNFREAATDSEKRHKCQHCESMFKTSIEVRLHELKHEDPNENHCWFCIFCEQGFETEQAKNNHLDETHPDKKFKCKYCGDTYSSIMHFYYMKHLAQHAGNHLLPCIQCGKEFARKKLYKLHSCDMGKYHDNSCVQCPPGTITFKSFKEHREHLDKVHQGIYKFICGLCPQVFDTELDRKEHQKEEHPAGKRFKICNICGMMIKSVNVKYHNYSKHGIGNIEPRVAKKKKFVSNKIICDICGKSVEKVLMKKHVNDKHGTEQLQCPKCPKILRSQPSLKDHMDQSHRQFPCDVCGKPQRNKQMYQFHIFTVHTPDGQKPFQCSFCPRGFGKKRALQEHENIHTNNKPHKCRFPDCGIGFSAISNRTNHEKSVHGGYRRPKRTAVKTE